MKKMKKGKLLAGTLSVLMFGAMSIPAHAEGKTMSVTYTQPSTWTVSIPSTTLSQNDEVMQTVAAAEVNIRPEQKLQVTIQGMTHGEVILKRSVDNTTTTSVVSTTKDGQNPINTDTVVAEFENQSTAFANQTTGKLYFSPVPTDTKAGSYAGTITYVMKVIDKN